MSEETGAFEFLQSLLLNESELSYLSYVWWLQACRRFPQHLKRELPLLSLAATSTFSAKLVTCSKSCKLWGKSG